MVKKIVMRLSQFSYDRLVKQKTADGYEKRSWQEWLMSKAAPGLQVTDAEGIRASTRGGLRQMWGRNMGFNIAYTRRKDMKSLRDITPPQTSKCIVAGGGPSIELHHQLETIANADRKDLTIITSDRMLIPLLSHGVVPEFVVSVDGSDIILKFYKHPLVKQNLDKIKILAHIAINPLLTRWLYRNHAQVYWFLAHQGYVNEKEVENSDAIVTICMTSSRWHPKGVQTIVAAGNVGVCAWATAIIVLKQLNVGLIGFDMGYPEGTPLNKTYYYSTFLNTTQGRLGANQLASLAAQMPYEKEYNPALGCYTYTDQVFRSYKEMFCGLLNLVPSKAELWNLTEGGALYHPKLKYATLKDWLKQNN
jgi:hypothetical protein